MNIRNTISESAFLVNESRARRIDLSKDIYSYLWTDKRTNELWDDFSQKVYPYDDIELSIRNRFFLEQLKSFIDIHSKSVFINIGAGFTSYPFLLDELCRFVEVDFEEIINYKKKMLEKWIKEGVLPYRNIIFLSADISNVKDVNRIKRKLSSIIKNDFSFLLLEGITYYIGIQTLEYLFKIFRDLQKIDSILAFDFWQQENEFHPVFQRLRNFFAERFDFRITKYNLINQEYIKDINGYDILKMTNVQELEKEYSNTDLLKNYDKILPENYAVLKRI